MVSNDEKGPRRRRRRRKRKKLTLHTVNNSIPVITKIEKNKEQVIIAPTTP